MLCGGWNKHNSISWREWKVKLMTYSLNSRVNMNVLQFRVKWWRTTLIIHRRNFSCDAQSSDLSIMTQISNFYSMPHQRSSCECGKCVSNDKLLVPKYPFNPPLAQLSALCWKNRGERVQIVRIRHFHSLTCFSLCFVYNFSSLARKPAQRGRKTLINAFFGWFSISIY